MRQLGIGASWRLGNGARIASLLNRPGALVFISSCYQLGHRLWYAGLYHCGAAGASRGLWEPLYSFAQLFLDTFDASYAVEEPDGCTRASWARAGVCRFPVCRAGPHLQRRPRRAYSDRSMFSTLLIDQGMFVCQNGWFDGVRCLFPRLREIASQLAFPNLAQVNRLLERRLAT